MKKLLIFLLAALTAFGAGCDKKGGGNFENYTDVAGKPANRSTLPPSTARLSRAA